MYKQYDVLGAGEEDLRPVDELDPDTEPNMILDQLCTEFERQNFSDEVMWFVCFGYPLCAGLYAMS
jgi:hypothetical protein